jgi:predicted metal-dependent HD superfamily phosphohydrolase
MDRTQRIRWHNLWNRVASTDPELLYDALVEAYGEAHRAYHNLEHIHDCLAQFDLSVVRAVDHDAVELAIWFHDVVYDTHAADNEEASALWATRQLEEAEVDAQLTDRVARLINFTKHDASPSWADAMLLVDIDLSILGRQPRDFDAYQQKIRQEYDWVSEPEYQQGRLEFLEGMLSRPKIYSTEWFFQRYEQQARLNLNSAVQNLRYALDRG